MIKIETRVKAKVKVKNEKFAKNDDEICLQMGRVIKIFETMVNI